MTKSVRSSQPGYFYYEVVSDVQKFIGRSPEMLLDEVDVEYALDATQLGILKAKLKK
jgi:isochorismate synthase EntC